MTKDLKKDNNYMPCTPLNHRVVVELITESASEGGVILPEKAVHYGYIRAIGPNVDPHYISPENAIRNSRGLRLGDKVTLPRGATVGERFTNEAGTDFLLVPIDFISAIVERRSYVRN